MKRPHLASSSSVALTSSPETCRLQTGMFEDVLFIYTCLVRQWHLRIRLTTYTWFRMAQDVGFDNYRSSTNRLCTIPCTHNTFGDRSFAAAYTTASWHACM